MNTTRLMNALNKEEPVDEIQVEIRDLDDEDSESIFKMDEELSDLDDEQIIEYEVHFGGVKKAGDGKHYKLATITTDGITYDVVEACDTDIRIVAWNIDELTELNPNEDHEYITDIINNLLAKQLPDYFKEKNAQQTKHIFIKKLLPIHDVAVKTVNAIDLDDTIIKTKPSFEEKKPIYIEQKQLTTALETAKLTGINICCTARSHTEVKDCPTSPIMACNILKTYKDLIHAICFVDQVGIAANAPLEDLTLKYLAMIYFAAKYLLPRASIGLMDNSYTEISECRRKQFADFHVDISADGELKSGKHFAANLKWLESHQTKPQLEEKMRCAM